MGVKENINLELEGMLKVREDRINAIRKVMEDAHLQDITRKSLENEMHRLKNEIETIKEVEARCNFYLDRMVQK